jgi:hypothetical protein
MDCASIGVCGGGIVRTSRGMCSLARVSTALGVKHLIAQFGLIFTLHFRVRTDLSSYFKVVEMHTWSSDWKRVIIIFINWFTVMTSLKILPENGHLLE